MNRLLVIITVVLAVFSVFEIHAQELNPAANDSLSYYKSTQRIVDGISKGGITEYAPSISAMVKQ